MATRPLPDLAIEAALYRKWEEAISLNQQIIAADKSDTNALLRLAFAYLQTGKYSEAKITYQKVIKLDRYNVIAVRQLTKIDSLPVKNPLPEIKDQKAMSPLSFLEDPGTTKITQCVHIAPQKTLAVLSPGQEVFMKTKNHSIEIRDHGNRYIAALPDDLSFRLLKLISAKNEYRVFIRSLEKNCLTLFVRETVRGTKFRNQPSFSNPLSYNPVNREVVAATDKPDTTETGGNEDES